MAYKPDKHGRDHCPGGEDPIPCLADETPRFWTLSYNPNPILVGIHSSATPVEIIDYDTSFEDTDSTYLDRDGNGLPHIAGPGMYRVDFGFTFGTGGASTGNAWHGLIDVFFNPAQANTEYRWVCRIPGVGGPSFARSRNAVAPYTDIDLAGHDAVGVKNVLLAVSRVDPAEPSVPILLRHVSSLDVTGSSNVADAYHFELAVTRIGDIQSTVGGSSYI